MSHFVPFPPKGGAFQRSYNLITRIAARHEVHLLALRAKRGSHPDEDLAQARDAFLQTCRSVEILDISQATTTLGLATRAATGAVSLSPLTVSIFTSAALRRRIVALCREHAFDVVHLDSISMAQYLRQTQGLPSVMSHHGAESFMIHRRIRLEPALLNKALFVGEWLALERYERRMCPRVTDNIVVSDLDRRLLQKVAPDARFTVVDNGVDVGYFTPTPVPRVRRLIFAGRLDQYSNRDAILSFMADAWPPLRSKYEDIAIDIIGNSPPAQLVELATRDPHVHVHGFVPDVRPFFRDAAVAICPIRDGGGTRIKVLDALAQGRPLVTTSIGAEGLDVVPDRDVLIADTSDAFVTQIGRLFQDPALGDRLAADGRALVERRYSWASLAGVLNDSLERAAATARRGSAQPASLRGGGPA